MFYQFSIYHASGHMSALFWWAGYGLRFLSLLTGHPTNHWSRPILPSRHKNRVGRLSYTVILQQKEFMKTTEARNFLIKLMGNERVFDNYIKTRLAGDFAVKLQQIFEKQYNQSLEPTNAADAKTKIEQGCSVQPLATTTKSPKSFANGFKANHYVIGNHYYQFYA